MMLLWFANRLLGVAGGFGKVVVWVGWVFEESVELAGYVAFETAAGFSGGFALADAFGEVGPGFGTVSGAADGYGVEGLVEFSVAASV